MQRDEIRFEATSEAAAELVLGARCNDGRAWLVTCVFGSCTATAYDGARLRFPREAVQAAERGGYRYWRSGAWARIPEPQIQAAERAAWEAADRAAGVSDGGGDPIASSRRFFRRQAKRLAARTARYSR